MNKPKKSDDWHPTRLDLVINGIINDFEQREIQGAFRKSHVVARLAEKERNRNIIAAVMNAYEKNQAKFLDLLKEE